VVKLKLTCAYYWEFMNKRFSFHFVLKLKTAAMFNGSVNFTWKDIYQPLTINNIDLDGKKEEIYNNKIKQTSEKMWMKRHTRKIQVNVFFHGKKRFIKLDFWSEFFLNCFINKDWFVSPRYHKFEEKICCKNTNL